VQKFHFIFGIKKEMSIFAKIKPKIDIQSFKNK